MKSKVIKLSATAMMMVSLTACTQPIELKLINPEEDVTVEYGETVNLKFKDLVDTSEIKENRLADFKKGVKITDNIKNEKEKDYPATGEYEYTVEYEDQKLTKKVTVKDTVKPEISIKGDVTLEYGSELKEELLKSAVDATDLAEIASITFDSSSVDTKQAGSYEVKVHVEDASGNENEETVKVTVKEEVKQTASTTTTSKTSNTGTKNTNTGSSANTSNPSTNNVSALNAGTTASTPAPAPQPEMAAQISMEALSLINAERAKVNQRALSYSSQLGDIALKRAKEISASFSHSGLDKYKNGQLILECIASGCYSPNQAVRGWMNSYDHKMIMLDLGEESLMNKGAVACYDGCWVFLTAE